MGSKDPAIPLPDLPPLRRNPKEMTYKFMDYWVWVMEFENGDYEEIDGLVVAANSRRKN